MRKTIRPDGSLDPFDDFEDDGGTPEWRARHAPRKTMRLGTILRIAFGWFCTALIFPPASYIFMLWCGYVFEMPPLMSFSIFVGLIGLGVYVVKYLGR